MASAVLANIGTNDIERGRLNTLVETLAPLKHLFAGKRVLDFGASYGLSMVGLHHLGAGSVTGIEPDAERVTRGVALLAESGVPGKLLHVPDTARLPFPAGSFDFVLVNAVLEHIPQPRTRYIREMWRVVATGGVMLVNETPNKYLPLDYHTTGLMFVPWLSREVALRYALWRGKTHGTDHWESSGWRGLGHYELMKHLPDAKVEFPIERTRHRAFKALGLPAQLLDPYPTWIIRKR
jgi:ubiquinone/menaquinone biosynthesis C-methylase UbiE